MANMWIWLAGLGVITLGGIFMYAQSRDEKDPFGYLSELFDRFNLEETFSGTFLDKNWNPDLGTKKGSSINPKTGESELLMFGK